MRFISFAIGLCVSLLLLVSCAEDVPCYVEGAVRTSSGCECPTGTQLQMRSTESSESACVAEVVDASSDERSPAAEVLDAGRSDSSVSRDLDARVQEGSDAAATSRDAEVPDGSSCRPAAEVCNQQDDDCDGEVDEGVSNACGSCGPLDHALGERCTNGGTGLCAVGGMYTCIDGKSACNAPPSEPQPEVCDGVDNDCDGTVDEGFTKNACMGCSALTGAVGSLCLSPRASCAVTGRFVCSGTDSVSCESTAACAAIAAPSQKQLMGNGFTCALYGDGFVQCWGKNDWGQLGNGTRIDSTQPVDVIGLPNRATMLFQGASDSSACAEVQGDTSFCWGIGFNPSYPSLWSAIPSRGGLGSGPKELE